MNPNWSQIAGIARIVGPAIIGVLSLTHVISDSTAANMTVFLTSVLGSAIWSGFANTTLNLSKTVAAVPGVQVVADHTAPIELQKAAADRSDPTVKDIIPAPSIYSPAPAQRK